MVLGLIVTISGICAAIYNHFKRPQNLPPKLRFTVKKLIFYTQKKPAKVLCVIKILLSIQKHLETQAKICLELMLHNYHKSNMMIANQLLANLTCLPTIFIEKSYALNTSLFGTAQYSASGFVRQRSKIPF